MFFIELLKDHAAVFLKCDNFGLVRFSLFIIISIITVVRDIKYKKVFSLLLIGLVFLMLTTWAFVELKIFLICISGYIGIILLFILIFYLSKQGIGLGDSLYLGFFCSLYGWFFSFLAFILSFWIASLILIIPYLMKRIDKKTRIPFTPFIFTGCIIVIILGYFFK